MERKHGGDCCVTEKSSACRRGDKTEQGLAVFKGVDI